MHWYSPFPLSAALETRLVDLGVERFVGVPEELPAGSLLIYVQPHALLERSPIRESHTGPTAALIEGYGKLATAPAHHRLIADWRLEAQNQDGFSSWLVDGQPCPPLVATAPTPSDPVLVLLLQDLLTKVPDLLDHYLDLELRAELAQTPADTDYADRLLEGLDADQVLEYWRLRLQQLERLANLEAELTLATAALAEVKAELDDSLEQLHKLEKTQAQVQTDPGSTVEVPALDRCELDRAGWQAVIDAHPLESHNSAEWLNYAAALLNTLDPGPQQAHQQQQAGLAFLQAQKAGASDQDVRRVQLDVVRDQLLKAVRLVEEAGY